MSKAELKVSVIKVIKDPVFVCQTPALQALQALGKMPLGAARGTGLH